MPDQVPPTLPMAPPATGEPAPLSRTDAPGAAVWATQEGPITSIDEQIAVLESAWLTMRRRHDAVEHDGADPSAFRALTVIIEEVDRFRTAVLDSYAATRAADDPPMPPVLTHLSAVLEMGRSAQVRILSASACPDPLLPGAGPVIGRGVREAFKTPVSLGRPSRAQLEQIGVTCGGGEG